MQATRMVHLTGAPSEFAARVLVAKLGSAGILAEVRGVGGPYPVLGSPDVWVEEAEYYDATELIRADLDDVLPAEQERPASGADRRRLRSHRLVRPMMIAIALLLLSSVALTARCSPASTIQTR